MRRGLVLERELELLRALSCRILRRWIANWTQLYRLLGAVRAWLLLPRGVHDVNPTPNNLPTGYIFDGRRIICLHAVPRWDVWQQDRSYDGRVRGQLREPPDGLYVLVI